MKNKLLAQLRTSSQRSQGMNSSAELKHKFSVELKYKLLAELTKLHVKLMMSSQQIYMRKLIHDAVQGKRWDLCHSTAVSASGNRTPHRGQEIFSLFRDILSLFQANFRLFHGESLVIYHDLVISGSLSPLLLILQNFRGFNSPLIL